TVVPSGVSVTPPWKENAPGVSSRGAPPAAGIEYRCTQPSACDANTMRLPAANWNASLSHSPGYDPFASLALAQIWLAFPLAASQTQMVHGSRRPEKNPPRPPVRRMNASLEPSADQRGSMSRNTLGSTYCSVRLSNR